jgi:hypothetical protein
MPDPKRERTKSILKQIRAGTPEQVAAQYAAAAGPPLTPEQAHALAVKRRIEEIEKIERGELHIDFMAADQNAAMAQYLSKLKSENGSWTTGFRSARPRSGSVEDRIDYQRVGEDAWAAIQAKRLTEPRARGE